MSDHRGSQTMMDRRTFLKYSGMLGVGVAVGGSVAVGVGERDFDSVESLAEAVVLFDRAKEIRERPADASSMPAVADNQPMDAY